MIDKQTSGERDRVVGHLEREIARLENDGLTRAARSSTWAMDHVLEGDLEPLRCLRQLDPQKGFPVSIDEFLEDPDFLGYLKGEFGVWDAHYGLVRQMNPDVVCGAEPVIETALGGASGTGKALDVDTPIPVPGGWKRMGDIVTGDAVYDEHGTLCAVLMAHEVMHGRECHEIVFDDGSTIVADADHLWLTETKSDRVNGTTPRIKTTTEIARTLKVGGHHNHAIPLCGGIEGVEIRRPMIDPYVLGAWLGDGAAASGIIYSDDEGVVDELGKCALVEKKSGKYKWRVFGLNKSLRHWNLLDNKHIPARWLRASRHQRLALLQGLMDTDGSIDKRQGRCEFYSSNEVLALATLELCLSLGIKAIVKQKRAIFKDKDFGPSWRIGFTPPRGMPVFRLGRKLRYIWKFECRTSAEIRIIREVRPVASRPVKCLTVDSRSSLYLVGEHMVPTHNTTLAWINIAYQFYLLTCFKKPQKLFGLGPMTPIVFTIQSIKQSITKLVIYEPLRVMITSMPHIKRWCSWDKQREKSSLDFDNGIHILPVLARAVSLQGQAVIGGILDELSFMAVIEASKQVAGPRGMGGKFDQAEEVYTQTINRRSRSFGNSGISIGSVCSLSNTSYRDDFMDRHLAFIEEHRPDNVIARRLRRYKVEPGNVRDVKMGRTITVQVGTDYHATRVIEPGDTPDEGATLIKVPEKYRMEFMYDGDKALREVAGIASAAIRPFLRERHLLANAFTRGEEMGLVPWTDVVDADLSAHGMPNWLPNVLGAIKDKHILRYIHVDLSKSRDRCGIAIVKPFGMTNVNMPDGKIKTVPNYAVEVAISLTPSGNAEVEPAVIRDWFMRLPNEHDIQIGGVSFDGYQSQESLQVLRRARVFAKEISVDRNMEPYEYLRSTLYEGRVAFCPSDLLMEELVMLEYNAEKGKVDHPPKGCFTSDTRVALADGTVPTFEELGQRYQGGEEFAIYTMRAEGVGMAWARSPRISRRAAPLVEVLLDNYQVVRCTPDHLFMLLDGSWCEAQYLTTEDAIMPLYRSRSASGGWAGYERVWCPVRRERIMGHHMAAELAGLVMDDGDVIHHVDDVKYNNDPDNVEVVSRQEHARHHTLRRHREDPNWVARLRAGHAAYRASGGNERSRQNMIRLNREGVMRASRTSRQQNHRVLSVQRVDEVADVWDIMVTETENFALASGVFVHNSKDIADAVTGAMFNCSNQRTWRTKTGFYDQDGEKVSAKGDRGSTRPRGGPRPSKNKGRRRRKSKEELWDVRPAQQERDHPEALAEDMILMDPPKGWMDKHGG